MAIINFALHNYNTDYCNKDCICGCYVFDRIGRSPTVWWFVSNCL